MSAVLINGKLSGVPCRLIAAWIAAVKNPVNGGRMVVNLTAKSKHVPVVQFAKAGFSVIQRL